MFLFNIVQSVTEFLSLMLAYLFSVTVAGASKAWAAKKVGDYTPEHAGFLTLDPLVHIDPLGMIALLLTGFGWGRDMPINLFNIKRPYRDLKILMLSYSTTMVHILLATISILLDVAMNVMLTIYTDSTIISALKIIFSISLSLNLFLALWRFIQNTVDLMFIDLIARKPEYIVYIRLASIALILLIYMLFRVQILSVFFNISRLLAGAVLNLFI